MTQVTAGLARRGRSRRRAVLIGATGIVGLAGALGAAGCARTSAEGGTAGLARPEVSLTYWKSLSGPRHDAQVALVDAFHAERPDVRVTLEHAGEYGPAAEKLRVALAGGTPPDVAMLAVNTDLPAFARLGVLQPLDGMTRDVADGFYPGFVRDSRVESRLYALPFARSTPLLYMNADQLRSAGLPDTLPGAAPATWPAFLELSRRLVRPQERREGELEGLPLPAAPPQPAAYGTGTNWWEFQPLLWAFGGAFSDGRLRPLIAEPAAVEAVQFLADLVHRHRVAIATRAAQREFVSGRIALLTVSAASLSQIEAEAPFRVLAAPLPVHRQGGVPGGGAGLALLRRIPTAQRAAAWAFVEHMTATASTARFARETGYTPVRPAALLDPQLQRHLAEHPNFRTALDQLPAVRPTDAALGAPFANRAIEEALGRLLFDGAPAAQVCAALEADLAAAAASIRR